MILCLFIVRADADKNAHQSQALWSACQSLHQAVKNELNENPDSQPIPLAKHVDAISKAGGLYSYLFKIHFQIPLLNWEL